MFAESNEIGEWQANRCRMRLLELKRKERAQFDTDLKEITANAKMAGSTHTTQRLLTKQWAEDRRNWRVASKLSPRMTTRLHDLVKYGPP